MFQLIVNYGLRASEVSDLKLEDIRWRGGCLHVSRRKTTAPLVFPLTDAVANSLVAYLSRGRPTSSYRQIFLRHRAPAGVLKPTAVSEAFQAWSTAKRPFNPIPGLPLSSPLLCHSPPARRNVPQDYRRPTRPSKHREHLRIPPSRCRGSSRSCSEPPGGALTRGWEYETQISRSVLAPTIVSYLSSERVAGSGIQGGARCPGSSRCLPRLCWARPVLRRLFSGGSRRGRSWPAASDGPGCASCAISACIEGGPNPDASSRTLHSSPSPTKRQTLYLSGE